MADVGFPFLRLFGTARSGRGDASSLVSTFVRFVRRSVGWLVGVAVAVSSGDGSRAVALRFFDGGGAWDGEVVSTILLDEPDESLAEARVTLGDIRNRVVTKLLKLRYGAIQTREGAVVCELGVVGVE